MKNKAIKEVQKQRLDIYKKYSITKDGYEAIDSLHVKTKVEVPYPLKGIQDRVVRFEEVIDKTDIINFIADKIKEENYEG